MISVGTIYQSSLALRNSPPLEGVVNVKFAEFAETVPPEFFRGARDDGNRFPTPATIWGICHRD